MLLEHLVFWRLEPMSIHNAWNAYIFRDGKNIYRGADLLRELCAGIAVFSGCRTELLDLLLRAGELECALSDTASVHARQAEAITQSIADALVSGATIDREVLIACLNAIAPPVEVKLSPPEGFTYYALHPLDMADLAREIGRSSQCVAVIGIRSIGTTLGAVVQAALRADGVRAERITVRPEGHPYDRKTTLSPEQWRWILAMCNRSADFLVVDEGPGMSGSSFLSCGEALVEGGVSPSRVRFVGSRTAEPDLLTASNAGTRWRAFRFDSVGLSHYLPVEAKEYWGGGIWRGHAFVDETAWPASWTQMERTKFLSKDGTRFYKYEGLGRFGRAVHERTAKVADGEFGPAPLGTEEGFGVYPFMRGRYLSCADANETVLKCIANYCAFRSENLASNGAASPDLEMMLSFNARQDFELHVPASLRLEIEHPVIADGRMLPHKWIDDGRRLLKLDSAAHGDDHFFPGPTDIAWDLAGAIIEWKMEPEAARFFLDCYESASGDDPSQRLRAYLAAYSVFRMAYCKMASAAMRGTFEQERLEKAYRRYKASAAEYLENVGAVSRDVAA